MAVLSASEKRDIAMKYVKRAYKELNVTADLDLPQLLAAIQPTETWIEDNQGSFNTVLPNPFKTTATLQQKTLLFCYVAMKRAELI